MINRYLAICDSCEMQFIFRAVVPLATTDSLRFCCPGCGIELSSDLELDYSVPKMDLSPLGFTLDSNPQSFSGPIVTVATDLPVHKNRHTNSLNEGGSPFLLLLREMGASFNDYKEKVDSLQRIRQQQFPQIRQIIDYARSENWSMVRSCLHTMFEEEIPEDDLKTIYVCYRILGIMYAPFIAEQEMLELLNEYYNFLNDCLEKKVAYKALLYEWRHMPIFRGFRTKGLSAFLRVLSHFDAFIVGLLYNEMPNSLKLQIDDYRIFRDDYSVVKALYHDLFELISQFLIFFGAIVNLSARNDPWHYVTGVRSFNAFKRKRAFERFQILSEVPKLSFLLGSVSRPMRNLIGHFSADYDPCTGNLRYDDGSQQNYILFLGDFYAAVKALWFILVFIEKSDLDMIRLGITFPDA